MTSGPRLRPFSPFSGGGLLRLEILPVKEKEGPRKFSRRHDTVRVVWIVWDSQKAPLSGGFTLAAAPAI